MFDKGEVLACQDWLNTKRVKFWHVKVDSMLDEWSPSRSRVIRCKVREVLIDGGQSNTKQSEN